MKQYVLVCVLFFGLVFSVFGQELDQRAKLDLNAAFEFTDEGNGTAMLTRFKGNGTVAFTEYKDWRKLTRDVSIPGKIILDPDDEKKRRELMVVAIVDGVFSGRGLTSVTIPNGVETIGKETFFDNYLTEITIPDSVTGIGPGAFGNNRLTKITIGANVNIRSGGLPYTFRTDYEKKWNKQAGTYTRPGRFSTTWTKQ